MKKSSAIFLLIILLLQGGGLLLIFKIQQFSVRWEKREVLNSDQTRFQKIFLSPEDYQKYKINDDEISIEGKMYDIKSITYLDTGLEILAVRDTKEENILSEIEEFITKTNQQGNSLPVIIKRLFSLSYFYCETDLCILFPVLIIPVFHPLNLIINSRHSDILTPPPEMR